MPRLAVVVALLASALPAAGQVRTSPGDSAISEHTGTIGEGSRPVGEGSRSMHDGDPTIGESSGGPVSDGRMRYGPVSESSTRSMLSGPVSSISRGPMTQPRTLRDGGSMTASSAGAVKHDKDQPLGSRISQPLRELAPLQEQLRALRQHGDAAAVAAAAAPVIEDVDVPAAHFDDTDNAAADEVHQADMAEAEPVPAAEVDQAAAPDHGEPAVEIEPTEDEIDAEATR